MKKVLFVLSMILLMPNAALAAAPAADAPASTWLSWLKSGKPTREKVLKARQYVRSQWGCITGRVQCSARKKYALRTLAAAVTAAAAAGIGYGARAYLSSQTGTHDPAPATYDVDAAAPASEGSGGEASDSTPPTTTGIGYDAKTVIDAKNAAENVVRAYDDAREKTARYRRPETGEIDLFNIGKSLNDHYSNEYAISYTASKVFGAAASAYNKIGYVFPALKRQLSLLEKATKDLADNYEHKATTIGHLFAKKNTDKTDIDKPDIDKPVDLSALNAVIRSIMPDISAAIASKEYSYEEQEVLRQLGEVIIKPIEKNRWIYLVHELSRLSPWVKADLPTGRRSDQVVIGSKK